MVKQPADIEVKKKWWQRIILLPYFKVIKQKTKKDYQVGIRFSIRF
jgi:hypothetical protein